MSIYNFRFQSEQDPCFSSFFSKLSCIHFGSWDGNKEWSVSMNENEDIAEYFREKGLNPNLQDNFGRTPLHYICTYTKRKMLKYILEKLKNLC